MKILALPIAVLMASCAPSSPVQRASESRSKFNPPPVVMSHNYPERDESPNSGEWGEIPAKTPKEEAVARKKAIAYYRAVAASISNLDDGASPASMIARVAVRENAGLLRDWKRSDLANLLRMKGSTPSMMDSTLVRLPAQSHIDEATGMVLRMRKP